MILVDANIMMYAAGAEHPNKQPSITFLEKVATRQVEAAIDAETLQEILHRYRAIRRWEDGKAVYDMSRQIFSTVFPITVEVLDHCRSLLESYPALMARDAIHAAVTKVNSVSMICSFDRDFDQIRGLRRIQPPIATPPL